MATEYYFTKTCAFKKSFAPMLKLFLSTVDKDPVISRFKNPETRGRPGNFSISVESLIKAYLMKKGALLNKQSEEGNINEIIDKKIEETEEENASEIIDTKVN